MDLEMNHSIYLKKKSILTLINHIVASNVSPQMAQLWILEVFKSQQRAKFYFCSPTEKKWIFMASAKTDLLAR